MSTPARSDQTPPERILRFAVPTEQALQRLLHHEPPAGMRAGAVRAEFFRDVYYDTSGGDLERRGAEVRLRVHDDGTRLLSVTVRDATGEDASGAQRYAQAEVPDGETPFAGSGEPQRLLSALVDPARLQVGLELETTRRERTLGAVGHPEVAMNVVCDAVDCRYGDLVVALWEMEIHLPAGEDPRLHEWVRGLEEAHDLQVVMASRLASARERLEALEMELLGEAVRGAREVAVLAHRAGAIGFRREGASLRIPVGAGWGEAACRRVLRSSFGRGQAQVRRLGNSAGLGARPALEVWLAEGVSDAAGESVEWVLLERALGMVGSPRIRDSATLRALHFAAREPLLGGEPQPEPAGEEAAGEAAWEPSDPLPFAATPSLDAAPVPGPSSPRAELPPGSLINMELSELAFNERVLALAEDERTPLLERVRFLSILGSNLDQFFMTRVAGFHQQVSNGSTKRTLDGLTPEEQLDVIGIRVRQMYARIYRFLWTELVPELRGQQIHLLDWSELEEREREYLADNYMAQLSAVLTPLAADSSHPFPHIRNLRPALAVMVQVPETGDQHFAAIELPNDLPRFVPLPGGRRFIRLEQVITATLPTLYQGVRLLGAHLFRVTRSANLSLGEEGISDLLQAVEEKVQRRPLGPVVRLEVEESMPAAMRERLLHDLQFEAPDRVSTLRAEDVYTVDRLIDLFGLREIASLPLTDLHYPPLQRTSPLPAERPIWSAVRERDVLLRFPHHSFETTVERLLSEAARDPKVVAIKITLYRTNRSSRVVKLLRKARRKGKEVVAVVELKASFDERRNIEWARTLESAGIHVVYGPPHLKVHAKIALVVRREKSGLRRYLYVGTGNLNAATAANYTDLALLSTSADLGDELLDVFNALTGYSTRSDYEHLLVAPYNMRARFLQLIEREAEHARAGRGGRLTVKLNGLTDPEIIAALYRASQAGVRIELIVRGLCALRPGLPGLSENIRVFSLLGRFLEHARIYRFNNAGSPEHFIGSADWRPRNLSRRVEVVAPVLDPAHRAAMDEILHANLHHPDLWELLPDGRYVRRAEVDASGSGPEPSVTG